ncbi:MAG: VWA domain-containing protein [Ruminococcaceae bacterium]|nr:VWA domain-containing protein [Oscillospiraceae bacterium]
MKSKQEKTIHLLEAMDQADEKLVQHAMYVDSADKFLALHKPGALRRWGSFAACLALLLVMLAAPWALSKLPANIPATNPTTITTQPTTGNVTPETVAAMITRLQDAVSAAETGYSQALAYVTDDFQGKPDGTNDPVFTELTAQLSAARDARVAALSTMMAALESLDLKDGAAADARIAEAEQLLAPCSHSYGQRIRHSSTPEGTPCPEADFYQFCDHCNDLLLSKESHIWYYSQGEDGHQLCCRACDTVQETLPHSTDDTGKCRDCGYIVNAKLLILESVVGQSEALCSMIDSRHSFTVIHITDPINMPDTPEKLQAYHEVILVNISHNDMPEGFDALLESYVRDFGGGLLTVGGEDAYHPEDVGGNCYGDMLPVDLTPPSMAVMILVDTSGSMWQPSDPSQPYEQSKLFAAVQGAIACLDVLTERDYVGVMSLGDMYDQNIELIPRPQYSKIVAAIDEATVSYGGGTMFWPALEAARHSLLDNTEVEKRHIILITDGMPGDHPDMYQEQAALNTEAGITMSIVGIQCDEASKRVMLKLIEIVGGDFYDVQELQNVSNATRDDLSNPALRAFQYQNYTPHITEAAIFPNITQERLPSLGGAYYSVLKEGATEILGSPYGPLYAQWNYGKGTVGSFMCDLDGTWSADFITSETGKEIINSIVSRLINAPTEETLDPSPAPDPVSASYANQPLYNLPTKKRW